MAQAGVAGSPARIAAEPEGSSRGSNTSILRFLRVRLCEHNRCLNTLVRCRTCVRGDFERHPENPPNQVKAIHRPRFDVVYFIYDFRLF